MIPLCLLACNAHFPGYAKKVHNAPTCKFLVLGIENRARSY